MSLVIKLTGRVFNDVELVRRYAQAISGFKGKVVVVAGGGDFARRYIEAARALTGNESLADTVGIMVSRINALILAYTMRRFRSDVYLGVPESLRELGEAYSSSNVVVMGGLQPGQSTTMVAVLAAEYLGIDTVVNCSNIDALYTDDPRRNPSAKPIREATVDEVLEILRREGGRAMAGTYDLIDEWALAIMKRAGLKMIIIDGKDPSRLESYLSRGVFEGTLIKPS